MPGALRQSSGVATVATVPLVPVSDTVLSVPPNSAIWKCRLPAVNVFPVEVENLLVERADVTEVAVIGVPDAEFGQRLKAFVVPAAGAVLDADEIRSYVRANLARYKVPRDVEFLDALPRNATGKVLRNQLS